MSMLDRLKFWKKEESFSDFPAPPDFTAPPQLSPEPSQQPLSMEQFGMPKPVQGINEPPSDISPPQQFVPPQQSFPPMGQSPPFQPQAFQQQSQFQSQVSPDQQWQLVSAKLDTIKAQLETVLQRLDRLERKDEQHAYQQRWRSAI